MNSNKIMMHLSHSHQTGLGYTSDIPKPKLVVTSEQELNILVDIAQKLNIDRTKLFSEDSKEKVMRWITLNSGKLPYIKFVSLMRLLSFDGNLES